MLQSSEGQSFELAETFVCKPISELREPFHESLHEPSHESSCEQTGEPQLDLMTEPDRLWSLQELANRYGYKGIRTVQNMRDYCLKARPDLILEVKDGRKTLITAEGVALLDSLKSAKDSGIDSPQWVQDQQLKPQTSDPKPSSTATPPETIPPAPAPSNGGELTIVSGAGAMEVHTVPSSKIEVLANFIDSKKPQPLAPINLNGTAESGTDRAIALLEHLQQRRERTDAVIGQLYEREQSVSTTEQAIEALEQELEEQTALEQAAITKAHELREREAEAQERLGKLEKRSQS